MTAVSLHYTVGGLISTPAPLSTCTVQQPRAALSRLHMLLHGAAICAVLYYRVSAITGGAAASAPAPLLPWVLITLAEAIFAFIWALSQAFRWRPVARTVAPASLPEDARLPAVDVFVCTSDAQKEPVMDVMNTVLSAIALDYPADKLAVYLSDDGGCAVTLGAVREAGAFAREWVPFCRKFGVGTRSPEAFFSSFSEPEREALEETNHQFKSEEEIIQSKYEIFKRNVEKAAEIEDSIDDDRPPHVEVIVDDKSTVSRIGDEVSKLPLLVYVSREKRSSYPHRFKASALNALLRVSGVMSNAPYMLVLDCDMYCNDPTSTKQAMCYHLDPKLSHSLSYTQFPQLFYNISRNDIYDGQARSAYKTKYQGMDGLRGAVCAGTGYYMKKKSLYCSPNEEDQMLHEMEKKFGSSKELITSLQLLSQSNGTNPSVQISDATVVEAKKLASCIYERNTRWGKDIGYSYDCMLESTFTGYLLHCKGWKSAYLYPENPCFLGCATIDMNDALVQLMKWASSLVQVGLSQYSPLTYGMSRMSILQSMCYGYFAYSHFISIACALYGIIPQLAFLYGIPLYPKVTNPWFAIFAIVFLSSFAQHMYEVLSSGESIMTMWNEQRIWLIKAVTACLFGCLDVALKFTRMVWANMQQMNKVAYLDKMEDYEKGKFEFQGDRMFMVPLMALVLLNLGCLAGGVRGMIGHAENAYLDKMEDYEKGKFEFQGDRMFMVPLMALVLLNLGCLAGGVRGMIGHAENASEMLGQGILLVYVLALSVPILKDLIPKISK